VPVELLTTIRVLVLGPEFGLAHDDLRNNSQLRNYISEAPDLADVRCPRAAGRGCAPQADTQILPPYFAFSLDIVEKIAESLLVLARCTQTVRTNAILSSGMRTSRAMSSTASRSASELATSNGIPHS
jgi:hypothetical protein